MFTKGLAQMLLPSRGIRCNGVAPGPIWQVPLSKVTLHTFASLADSLVVTHNDEEQAVD